MRSNRRMIINVVCSIMLFATNLFVSFWVTRYIVKHVGVEASGFVSLANNFVVYAQLIVTALNSMAARFISIAYTQKDYKRANLYYNSVFWGNLIIIIILVVPTVYFIIHMQNLINIPTGILLDVKILFLFIFINFFISTGMPNWDCGTYVSGRMDRTYIPKMMTSLFRCLLIFGMFTFMDTHVWYVGLTSSLITLIMLGVNWYNTKSLTPALKIKIRRRKSLCSYHVIKELVGSGIWNSISMLGIILLSGLDLIICNIFLGANAMGILSVSKILPGLMQQLSDSIRSAFAPELTINYAKGDKAAVLRDINRAIKLTSVIMVVPIAGIIILGDSFFALWIPSQDAKLLQVLSVLSILGYIFTSGTQVLYNVFSTVNKVRDNAIAVLISGVLSSGITISLIVFTDMDIYAVAGVSTLCNLVRNMCFTLPATARYLGLKWYQFFPKVGSSVGTCLIIITIGFLIKQFLPLESWTSFFASAIVIGAIGLIISITILLTKEERYYLFKKVKSKLHIYYVWRKKS